MSQLIPFQPQNALPSVIAQQLSGSPLSNNPLAEGIGSTYANVSFKGKVFRVKHGGQEHLMVDPNTNQPMQYLDVVIIDAKSELSKTYYAGGFVEGQSEQPDCSSEDGINPSAPPGKQVQCSSCQLCPLNAYGSKKSADGVQTNSKACADTRKLAIVPAINIRNDRFGGPMLLRIPAASLTGLADFSRSLASQGAPYYAVIVRITFDYNVAYPKLIFQALQYITDVQAADVMALRVDPRTKDLLSSGAVVAPAPVQIPIAGAPPAQMIQPQPAAMVPQQYAPPQPQVIAQQPQYAPPQQQFQPQYAPPPQQPQQSTASFGAPTPAAAPMQAQPAPSVPTHVQPAQQYAPPPQQYAPPPQQYVAPQGQQFAPPQQQTQPQQQYAPPAQQSVVPDGVLNQIDNLLGM